MKRQAITDWKKIFANNLSDKNYYLECIKKSQTQQ